MNVRNAAPIAKTHPSVAWQMEHVSWWPLLESLSWCALIRESSHRNSWVFRSSIWRSWGSNHLQRFDWDGTSVIVPVMAARVTYHINSYQTDVVTDQNKWKLTPHIATEMLFWRNFCHWLRRKFLKWQLLVHPIIQIASKWTTLPFQCYMTHWSYVYLHWPVDIQYKVYYISRCIP